MLGANAQIESNVCDRGDSRGELLLDGVGAPGGTLLCALLGPGRIDVLQVCGLMQECLRAG
jgi:hypothetical protein